MKPYNKKIVPFAKYLRKNMTPWEQKLWYGFLRTYPLRFQRQKTIGNYIADFYCAKAKLIIELDGSNHFLTPQQIHDYERTQILSRMGLTVIRFLNTDIDTAFGSVCQAIDAAVQKAVPHLHNDFEY